MKKFIFAVSTAALIISTSSPAIAAVTLLDAAPDANPAGLTSANLASAQTTCDGVAAGLDADGTSAQSDRYTAEVVEGAPTLKSGPTEIGGEGDRSIQGDKSPGVGATYTPAHLEILGDPYRIGGSVNMFGIQQSVGGYYSTSAYDFTADFLTTYTHGFTCEVYKEHYVPAQTIHHPAIGSYVIIPHGGVPSQDEDAQRQNCEAFSALQPSDPLTGALTPPWWGQEHAGCAFVGSAAYDEIIDEHFEAPDDLGNYAGGSFDQDQTDNLLAHEDQGSGYFDAATAIIGQVVVCISPSTTTKKLPGAWTAKNGYDGSKCNTTWYNGGATVGVPNLNDGSHNFVTVPLA